MDYDFKKLKKKKSRLPAPPPITETKDNLSEPEYPPVIDGRNLNRTGRTEQFSTRVTFEFKNKVKLLAAKNNLMICELLEKAIAFYEENVLNSNDLPNGGRVTKTPTEDGSPDHGTSPRATHPRKDG